MANIKKKGVGRSLGAVTQKKKVAGRERFDHALTMAEQTGLLHGARTQIIRGRMPKALVDKAKERAGVHSDTKLIEVALATLAVADDYPDWLLSQRGTISKDVDLEF